VLRTTKNTEKKEGTADRHLLKLHKRGRKNDSAVALKNKAPTALDLYEVFEVINTLANKNMAL